MLSIQELKKQVEKDISAVVSVADLQNLKSKYLSEKGVFKEYFAEFKNLSVEEKKEYGKTLNLLKKQIEEFIDTKKQELLQNKIAEQENRKDIDLTAPFNANATRKPEFLKEEANKHPITVEIQRFLDVFKRMGFDVIEGRELDNDYYNFEALAMPKHHPAREMWDTFYTSERFIPAVHTSNMQVRVMRKYKKPPIRAVVFGKCFRNEEIDATHSHTFYQIEGVYVDKHISVANMIYTLKSYIEGFFEAENIVWKIQPAHFPFVEPGLEVTIQCVFCGGKGCHVCKNSGWIEILGAGMIHPDVLRAGGIDPEKYSGFAWGLGVERLVMSKNNINDMRLLYANDIRLLKAR